MSDKTQDDVLANWRTAAIFAVGLGMAIVGILNSAPSFWIIPKFGPFDSALIRPAILMASVLVIVLRQPFAEAFAARSPHLRPFGTVLEFVILAAAAWVFWRYYVDVSEIEEGLFDFELIHPIVALTGCAMFIVLCWRIWGAPLAICGIVAIFYLYTGQYWPWIFETSPASFVDSAEDLWFNLNDGVLGTIMGILIFTVFPFILLGTMLERSGGGHSLIKMAIAATARFRAGPAHAAILASGLFGTMSGGAVTNVVATGVITIPMIKRRGFAPHFAGGVEATASSAAPDHAADHGRSGAGDGRLHRNFLSHHYRGGAGSGACLLRQPVHKRCLRSAPARRRGRARTAR